MNIEELEDKHFKIGIKKYHFPIPQTEHTKLSIQFAIEVLKELDQMWVGDSKIIYVEEVEHKIKELKQYLDEK